MIYKKIDYVVSQHNSFILLVEGVLFIPGMKGSVTCCITKPSIWTKSPLRLKGLKMLNKRYTMPIPY